MENNKAYLQKLPIILLIAVVYAIGSQIIWKHTSYPPATIYLDSKELSAYFNIICLMLCVGLFTAKWKEIFISLGVYVIIFFAFDNYTDLQAAKETKKDGLAGLLDEFQKVQIVFYIIRSYILPAIPFLLFLYLAYKKTKFLPLSFLLLQVCSFPFWLCFYGADSIASLFGSNSNLSSVHFVICYGFFTIAAFVLYIISLAEIVNLSEGKKLEWKSSLVNLGNEYSKGNALLVNFFLNTVFTLLLFAAGKLYNAEYLDRSPYLLISYIMQLITIAGFVLVFGWYYRKFLLEVFISHNLRSKTLYWFSMFPVIGIFVLAIAIFDSGEAKTYKEKTNSLSDWAASSSTAITSIVGILLGLRFLLQIASPYGGGMQAILIALVTGLVFFWLVSHKSGYYFLLTLNLLALVGFIVAFLVTKSYGRGVSDLLGLFAVNIISCILIYPIYHFYDFEYIPAADENEPVDPENILGDLARNA